MFGSLDDEGVRHVPEVFALVGKKNSKTTSGAGLMVTALLMNEVPWAEFLFIGPTQEIADLAFQQAAGMVEADPDGYLAKRFHVVDHKKTIRDRRNKAFVKVKTFDMKVMTGSKPIGVLIDELHVMEAIHYAARVVGQIRGALESKKNSFLLIITTQSDEPPAGVFRAELQYARGVRAGRIVESRMLPLLYEFPEAMQTDRSKPWADPTYWPMVMPNLGRSLHLDTMIAGYRAAKEKGEEEERRWASQHLNIEIGLALQSDNWVGADFWAASPAHIASLAELKARCEVVVVGIDGGGLDDLLGLTLLGPERGTGRWLAWSRAWAHKIVLERRKEIASRLLDFEKEGTLTIVETPGADVAAVADIVCEIEAEGLLAEKQAIAVLRFKRWLTEIKHQAGGFDLVVYEQVRNYAGVDAAHAFGGWLAILTAWCDHHEIAYQGVPVGTIKRHVTGKGNADKAAVIAAIRARGFNPADDNEADALAILLWAIETQGGVR